MKLTERHIDLPAGPLLIFGGAYSNLEALVAVRAEAERRGIPPERVICTGDTPGYCSDPEACLDLVEDWGIHAIAGNVETNLVNGTDDCGCGFGDGSRCDMFSRLWYAYASSHVTARNLAYMAGLPDVLRFNYAGRSMAVLHGSPENQSEFVWASTEWVTKEKYLEQLGVEVAIGGHCGLPFMSAETSNELASVDIPDELVPRHVRRATETDAARRTSPRSGSSDVSEPDRARRRWINAGVIGMPANDGTPRTWFLILDEQAGELVTDFQPLDYDHRTAKAKMIDDRRLPVSYAATLTTGIWDNTEIMPAEEESREGIPLSGPAISSNENIAPASAPGETGSERRETRNKTMANTYYDPKDLKRFGKIAEWQEEMGEKFFNYYSGVTEGDSALTEREKALIALAVSHAIQCPYCIDAYTTNSLQSGADEEQMMEAVHVAAAVKAGTTLIYGLQMMKQVEKVTM